MLSIINNRAEHVHVWATAIVKHNYKLMCTLEIVINIMLYLLNSTGPHNYVVQDLCSIYDEL